MFRYLMLLIFLLVGALTAWAVPETVSLRVTDVTPRSFCLVWMSNQPVESAVEVFADAGMTEELTSELKIEISPDLPTTVAEAAGAKSIYQVRVSGLQAGTDYFVRSLSKDVNNNLSVGYSALQAVTTSSQVAPYTIEADGDLGVVNNDLLAFKVYVRPVEQEEAFAGVGDLLILETSPAAYPVTAFAGEGVPAGEAVIDLNNLFDLSRISLSLTEGAVINLRVYRGDTLSTLYHVRKLPTASGVMAVVEADRGWNLADADLDGIVGASDFQRFKGQYRQAANDSIYNPDFNFVQAGTNEGADEVIDLRDFSWFAGQYGKQGQP
jgi:hypothetical protein